MSLPVFVPQKVCLACDGCCRFKEADSQWRPKLSVDERTSIAQKKPLAEKIFGLPIDEKGYIKTSLCVSGYQCAFFKEQDNSCRIYQDRPFECQLYPYLLGFHDGRPAVFAHLNCPYVQEKFGKDEFKTYIQKLQHFFLQDEMVSFLKNNPQLVGDYSLYKDELEFLFDVKV